MASLYLCFFLLPPRLFSQIFFFRLRYFSREITKASLFSLTNVIPSMVYYNSVSAEVDGIGRRFGLFKTSCGCTSKKGTRPLLTNKFAGGEPHTFLKSAHALFEQTKSRTQRTCLHLKQIAKPSGNDIKESKEALELPEKCGTSVQRKQRKEVRRRGGAKTVKCFCVQGEKIML